ncbi:hypothetical protein CU102_00705 [Phyllobacterium brassicacearum]|uniref:Uncharacterized protein n=1 Tax=Phyllobacterium brassicacearum TaxID=314235 RepID=A0A2P7BVX0_9HYPH|nr:hypothetical protein CU102_00705 [Phyllobacterium brassicacearum]
MTTIWIIRLYYIALCLGFICLGYLMIAIGGPDTGTSGAILTGYVAGSALIRFGVGLAWFGILVEFLRKTWMFWW